MGVIGTTIKKAQGAVEALDLPSAAVAAREARIRNSKTAPHVLPSRQGITVTLRPIPGISSTKAFPNGQPFQFQVPPIDVFGEDGDFPHNDQPTVGNGEVSSPGSGPDLRTVSYSTMFLDWQPEWSSVKKAGWTPDPQRFIRSLKTIKDEGRPFHLLANQAVLRDSYDIDYAATLRSLHWELRSGEDDGYYVTVSFKEFRSQQIQVYLVGAAQHHDLPAAISIAGIATNVNTLSKLATKYYGDPSKFRIIASYNGLSKMLNQPNTVLTLSNVGRPKIIVPAATANKLPTGQTRVS